MTSVKRSAVITFRSSIGVRAVVDERCHYFFSSSSSSLQQQFLVMMTGGKRRSPRTTNNQQQQEAADKPLGSAWVTAYYQVEPH